MLEAGAFKTASFFGEVIESWEAKNPRSIPMIWGELKLRNLANPDPVGGLIVGLGNLSRMADDGRIDIWGAVTCKS